MTKLIGLSGSLRQGSLNTSLLAAATGLMPPGAELIVGSIRGIPLYDGDVEAAGGIPGVFKNAIDWLSRPPADIKRVFGGKPVALMGASPGGFGTILSQDAWQPVLHTLGAELWSGGRMMVSRAASVFDEGGSLADPKIREQLREFLRGFVTFAQILAAATRHVSGRAC
jgi:chromate reductase, NAD(P)H dehydrogenase (quinone)